MKTFLIGILITLLVIGYILTHVNDNINAMIIFVINVQLFDALTML